MNLTIRFVASALVFLLFSFQIHGSDKFTTDDFQIELDQNGYVIALMDATAKKNYVPEGNKGSLMAVVADGKLCHPTSFKKIKGRQYAIGFEQTEVQVVLKIEDKSTHVSFTVVNIKNDHGLEAIIWGPYPTEINQTIGENVGVVRNGEFAIGIQSLNPKTSAGKLDNIRGVTSYHGTAAEATEYGSKLQAFAIDRTKDRSKSIWDGWENRLPGRPMDVLNDDEGKVIGSAIALFGCKPEKALKSIGAIEVAEGLPHPEINGVWVKESKETNRAYAISPFTEDDVDQMIEYANKAGLRSLYHEEPFETWAILS